MSTLSDISDEKIMELSGKIDSVIIECIKEGLSLNATNGVFLARLMVTNHDLMNEDNFLDFIRDLTTEKSNIAAAILQ